jgi:hypothetical protein
MNSLKLKGVLIENNEKSIDFCKLNGKLWLGGVSSFALQKIIHIKFSILLLSKVF